MSGTRWTRPISWALALLAALSFASGTLVMANYAGAPLYELPDPARRAIAWGVPHALVDGPPVRVEIRADRLATNPGLVARRLRQPPKNWKQANLTVSRGGAYASHETAQLADPSVMPLGVWLLGTVLATFSVAWVWWSLSRVVASSRRAQPFTTLNARRLLIAGVVLLVGPVLGAILTVVRARMMISESILQDLVTVPWNLRLISLPSIGAGIALTALAATWRRGVEMQADVEGLV